MAQSFVVEAERVPSAEDAQGMIARAAWAIARLLDEGGEDGDYRGGDRGVGVVAEFVEGVAKAGACETPAGYRAGCEPAVGLGDAGAACEAASAAVSGPAARGRR